MNCLHCFVKNDSPSQDLTTPRAASLIHQLGEEKVESVTLSGGEPFERGDWDTLVGILKGQNISVQIISNGQHLDVPTARLLKKLEVNFVWLSLDGPHAEHNHIRQTPTAFERVMEAASHLEKLEVPFGFMTTLLSVNQHSLKELASTIATSGATLWQLWIGNQANTEDIWLSNEQIKNLLPTLPQIRAIAPQLIIGDNIGYTNKLEALRTPGFFPARPGSTFSGCYGGNTVIGIRNNGAVQNCLALPTMPSANTITTQPLRKLHAMSVAKHKRVHKQLQKHCNACDKFADCHGGCHAHLLAQSKYHLPAYCFTKKSERLGVAATLSASLLAACAITATNCHPHASSSAPEVNATSEPKQSPNATAPNSTTPKTPEPDSEIHLDTTHQEDSDNESTIKPTGDDTQMRPCMMSHIGCRDTFESMPKDTDSNSNN